MNLLFGESVSTQEVIEAIKTNDEIVMQIDQESSSYPVSGYSYGGDWVRLVFKSDIYIYEYETIKGWDRTEISPEPYLKPVTGIPATDLTESLNNDIQSGRELPQVTGSDDGKVLGVISGEWSKMNSPYQEFIIGVSLDNNDSFVVDTPAATIVDAVEAGKRCRIRFNFIAQFLFDIAIIRHQQNGDIDISTAPFAWEGSWKGFQVALVKENNIWTATATIYNP